MLFDMDGVLISSIGSARRCWRRWAVQYGVPDAEHFEIPHGVRAAEIIHRVKPDVDVAEALRVIEDMEIEDVGDLHVLPGAGELLRSLPVERWGIVTSATRRLLLARLNAAGLPVPERLVCADDVDRGKPDPEPYRRGADKLGLAAGKCIVVEDAPSGLRAGKAAGCRVLGVLGTHEEAVLREAGADWIVRSLTDVQAELSGTGVQLRISAV